jgi:nucleotide-binding universal stress UspA family protein
MNFKKIVIAVDMEESSLKTLAQIKKLNFSADSEVHLVHVFEYGVYNFDLMPMMTPNKEDFVAITELFTKKLQDVKVELGLDKGPKVAVKCLISIGAKQEFLQYADALKADLIIAASQEKNGLQGFFEGSFTSFLTKFSRANLLILRPEL